MRESVAVEKRMSNYLFETFIGQSFDFLFLGNWFAPSLKGLWEKALRAKS